MKNNYLDIIKTEFGLYDFIHEMYSRLDMFNNIVFYIHPLDFELLKVELKRVSGTVYKGNQNAHIFGVPIVVDEEITFGNFYFK